MNKYITTTLPYVNADPHIGYAWEVVRADAWARWQRWQGHNVFFNIGTDEHGAKIYERACELGLETQAYCDQQVVKWKKLGEILNLSFDNFIRTTDPQHVKAAQEFWRRVKSNGYIYQKAYKAKYCVGCELEKTESELVNGRCSLHPNRQLEIIEEENYFFRFSVWQEKLLKLYKKNPAFVVPKQRFNEIKKFVEMGLQDFSISRLKTKMPWGVEVPDDSSQVMYVWFDALVNYISAIGWPQDIEKFETWWPAIQVAGKDNLRQQSAMWQAMLMAVGLPSSRQIFINSFLTSGGQKMSKSLGNVITPDEMVAKFGVDGTRYLLLSLNSFGDDVDITWQGLTEKYNADLANGLGNLVARVANLLEQNSIELNLPEKANKKLIKLAQAAMDNFSPNLLLQEIWGIYRRSDEILSNKRPWKMEEPVKIKKVLEPIAQDIMDTAKIFQPLLPETAEKIIKQFASKQVKKEAGLFPRV